jgi:ankyrin repeat protein
MVDETPLYVASEEGHVEVVRALVEGEADINKAEEEDGWTPLLIASQEGHMDVVRVLMEGGADINKAAEEMYAPPYS